MASSRVPPGIGLLFILAFDSNVIHGARLTEDNTEDLQIITHTPRTEQTFNFNDEDFETQFNKYGQYGYFLKSTSISEVPQNNQPEVQAEARRLYQYGGGNTTISGPNYLYTIRVKNWYRVTTRNWDFRGQGKGHRYSDNLEANNKTIEKWPQSVKEAMMVCQNSVTGSALSWTWKDNTAVKCKCVKGMYLTADSRVHPDNPRYYSLEEGVLLSAAKECDDTTRKFDAAALLGKGCVCGGYEEDPCDITHTECDPEKINSLKWAYCGTWCTAKPGCSWDWDEGCE